MVCPAETPAIFPVTTLATPVFAEVQLALVVTSRISPSVKTATAFAP
jgi:hypothetical protein